MIPTRHVVELLDATPLLWDVMQSSPWVCVILYFLLFLFFLVVSYLYIVEKMTDNLAEDLPPADDSILGSSSNSSDDEDNQNRRSSYADKRRSKYSRL